MNNQRRQELEDVNMTLDEAIDRISDIIDEEQEAFDNMPEGLQISSRGDKMLEIIRMMEDLISLIERVKQNVIYIAKRK
jgi:hypothetical protein